MPLKSSTEIKTEALRLGFFACGIAKAEPVSPAAAAAFRQWLKAGAHATMSYMERYEETRLDPRRLLPDAQSVISVALSYAPARRLPEEEYQIACYAYGKDYHDVMRERLSQLATAIGTRQYRACCDTAPILERYWAVQAGLGWIGKNHQLILPHSGTMFFLGELLIEEAVDEYDSQIERSCGNCRCCIDACPTGALSGSQFDASRCLSYQTIENRGGIPDDIVQQMGNTIYGCDRCQQACPHNHAAPPTTEPAFAPSDELLEMTKEKWQALSEDDFRRLFKGSAVKRAKYSGLMRNIRLHEE